ncbi:MAG: Mur ligase family protein, partial [Acidimicrobiales bacterium]
AVWAVLQGVVVLAGVLSGLAAVFCAAGALATPAVVDLASTVTHPFEEHLGRRYVRRATERLRQVGPKVVAVTGSFGKTSTKGYIAHLLSGSTSVASSPASFNNKLGLARAVNEVLADSTQVFVAEMGTYGRGEIAELCSWMAPDISVITAIGPVHLERFGTEDEILQAKSEILAGAPCCVLMVDDARLDALGAKLRVEGKRVWRVSAGARPDADVNVVARGGAWELSVSASRERTTVPALAASARPANAACAVAVALELGVPFTEISKLLSTLPVAPHRLEQRSASGGFVILDDTYNANPAGVRVALDALQAAAVGAHRRVVVTPGMVELGSRQEEENARFAEAAGAVATDMIVVGRTNRKPLVTGFRRSMREGEGSLVVVDRREQAVDWVRAHLGEGDAVLYGNDLPDHYP